MESPISFLRSHAKQAPWNARGLAAYATALVDSAGVKPTNAAARAALTARGVRFYVSTGLLGRPEGRGTAATYGYRHLLQILAIKIRQREGQTLDVIRRELADQTGDALERRVAQALAPALSPSLSTAPAETETGPVPWRRLVVIPGVEIHVRQDSPAARDDVLMAARSAVRAAIGRDA
jgi:hypothetical protein